MGTGQWYEYFDYQLKMCVLWTILWESKELWMLFPSHWASLWYDSGWLHHAGQANLTDRQAAVMAHFGIKAFYFFTMTWGHKFSDFNFTWILLCVMKYVSVKRLQIWQSTMHYNTLVCWFAGTNDSSTKLLTFQILFFFMISCKILCKNLSH